MPQDKFDVEVLGNLTEEEARKFFYGDGVAGGWDGIINDPFEVDKVPAGADEQWPAIYERCGGNIGLLTKCVLKARKFGKWEIALDDIVAGPLDDVIQGFEPKVYIVKGDEAPLWTGAQWKMVLERITTAPHEAVLASELKKLLGNNDMELGSTILLSMVKYNLLALRPPSTVARDLPQEVYRVGKKQFRVVTMPSAAHLWAAKALLEDYNAEEADEAKKAKSSAS
jgi:hypothetical protein